MIEPLLDNFRMILIGGIVLVVGIGQVNRVVGSTLGLAFWGFVAFLGSQVYARGGAVGLVDFAFPPLAFYALCGFMVVMNLFSLRMGIIRQRRRQRADRGDPL